MTEEITSKDLINPQSNYVTTSKLAKLCGVSRFTIINWVNRGKIKTIKTVGGHCRIPLSEVISFLETIHIDKEKEGAVSDLPVHCWEFAERTNYDKKCGNCLIYKRGIDYCFLVVRQFGKEVIRCEGDCLDCGYFNELFNKRKKTKKPSDEKIDIAKELIEEKKGFLDNFSYNIGYNIARSMQGLKKRIAELKKRLTSKSLRATRA